MNRSYLNLRKTWDKIKDITFIKMTYYDIWEKYGEDRIIGKNILESQKRYEMEVDT